MHPIQFGLAGILAASLMTEAALARVDQIKEIDVTTDLTAIQNPNAARFWTNLEADLEGAIASMLVGRLADDGAEIHIDIEEVGLANAFERELGLDEAVLGGQVSIVDTSDNRNFNSYTLTVSLGTTNVVFPDNQRVVLTVDDLVTYQALVETFASQVVSRLD